MKSKKIFILLLLVVFPLSMSAASAVYMKKEPDGSISFSDTPSNGSQKVKVEAPNIIKVKTPSDEEKELPPEMPDDLVPPAGVPKPGQTPSPQTPQLPKKEVYKSVDITSPTNQQTIWNPATVTVSVTVSYGDKKTGLQQGDKLSLSLDGRQVGKPGTSTSFVLNRDQLPRGEHSLKVSIVNDSGTILMTSKPITVFIHYNSVAEKELKQALAILRARKQ